MSFCRITGRSRGLPKPHYFPIIPPMSPAEARRFCRITGKSYGLPMHHYIPVLLRKSAIVSKCRITKVADVYGKRKHQILAGFRYVSPLLDPKSEAHKKLIELLTTKAGEGQFVYVVKERKCNVVISAEMENAVRDGTIKDVMLAKDSDKVLLRMKQGDNLSVDIKELKEDEFNSADLFEGEGVAEEDETAKKSKPKKNKKNMVTKGLAKMFEDRDQQAFMEQVTEVQNKSIKEKTDFGVTVKDKEWKNVIEPVIDCCDWVTFEAETSKLNIDKRTSKTNVLKKQNVIKIKSAPIRAIHESVQKIEPKKLDKTDNVFEKLRSSNENGLECLPSVQEIPDILRQLSSGILIEKDGVIGMYIVTDKPRFIVGQMVTTSKSSMFVPGQTLSTAAGKTFVPGLVVNSHDGPGMIPGLVITKQENTTFLPGHHVLNNAGECEFVTNKSIVRDSFIYKNGVKSYVDINSNDISQKIVINSELISTIEKESNLYIEDVKAVSEKLGFENEMLEKVSEIILAVTHMANNISNSKIPEILHKNNITKESCSENMEDISENINILKNALYTAVSAIQESSESSSFQHTDVYNAIGKMFANLQHKELVLDSLCKVLQSTETFNNVFGDIIQQDNHKYPHTSKLEILKSALNMKDLNETVLTEKLSAILDQDILVSAFQNISSENPELLKVVLNSMEKQFSECTSDSLVSETLYKSIVNAMKQSPVQINSGLISSIESESHINIKDVKEISAKLGFEADMQEKISGLVLGVVNVANNIVNSKSRTFGKSNIISEIDTIFNLEGGIPENISVLKDALLTAVNTIQQSPNVNSKEVCAIIGEMFANLQHKELVLESLCKVLQSPEMYNGVFDQIVRQENHKLPNTSKVEILKSALAMKNLDEVILTEKLSAILEQDISVSALQSISNGNPDILKAVLNLMEQQLPDLTSDTLVSEVLYKSIVSVMKQTPVSVSSELISVMETESRINIQNVKDISKKLGFESDSIDKVSGLVLAIVNVANNVANSKNSTFSDCTNMSENDKIFYENLSEEICENIPILKNVILTAVNAMQGSSDVQIEDICYAVGEIFANLKHKDIVLESLYKVLQSKETYNGVFSNIIQRENHRLPNASKLDILKSALTMKNLNETTLTEKLSALLEQDISVAAFQSISNGNPDILKQVLNLMEEKLPELKSDDLVSDVLYKSIVSIMKQTPISVSSELISAIETESHFNIENVKNVSKKLGFENDSLDKVSGLMLAILNVANNVVNSKTSTFGDCVHMSERDKNFYENLSEEICENIPILKNAILTAVNAMQGSSDSQYEDVCYAVGEIFANLQHKDLVLESLCKVLQSKETYNGVFSNIIQRENHRLPNVSKLEILKSALTMKNLNETTLNAKLSALLEEDISVAAFQSLSNENPDLLKTVLNLMEQKLPELTSDAHVSELLYKSIESAMKQSPISVSSELIRTMETKSPIKMRKVKAISKKLGFENDTLNKVSGLVLAIVNVANNVANSKSSTFGDCMNMSEADKIFYENLSEEICENIPILKNALLTAINAMNGSSDVPYEDICYAIGEIFANLQHKEIVLESLCKVLQSEEMYNGVFSNIIQRENHRLPKASKLEILKSALTMKSLNETTLTEKLAALLDDDKLITTFQNISNRNPEFLSSVLQIMEEQIPGLTSDALVSEVLYKSVVTAVKQSSESVSSELISGIETESCLNIQDIKNVSRKLGFENELLEGVSGLVLAVTNVANNIVNSKNSTLLMHNSQNNDNIYESVGKEISEHISVLKSALLTAVGVMQESSETSSFKYEDVYYAIGKLFSNLQHKELVLESLCKVLQSNEMYSDVFSHILQEENHRLPNTSKLEILKSALTMNNLDLTTLTEKLSTILEKDISVKTLKAITDDNPDLLKNMLSFMEKQIPNLTSDTLVSETLYKSIVNAVKQSPNLSTDRILETLFGNTSLISTIEMESHIRVQDVKPVSEKLGFRNEMAEKVSELVLAVTHVANNIVNSKNPITFNENNNNKNILSQDQETSENIQILKMALLAAVGVMQDSTESPDFRYEDVFYAVGEIFSNIQNKDVALESLSKVLESSEIFNDVFANVIQHENHRLPNVSKLEILKSALTLKNLDENTITEKLSAILDEDILVPAFQNVSHGNPDLLKVVLNFMEEQMPVLTSDALVSEALYKSIVTAVKESSEGHLGNMLNSDMNQEVIGELLQEAIGLAQALGMDETADRLYNILADPQSTDILAEDAVSLEILKRLTVMRQIAEKTPTLHSALTVLRKDPRGARSDPKLRELVRKSAALMVPEVKLQSSENIPCRLFYTNNMLAMEDFMTRNRQPGTLLIIKKGWQAVVPKEASRAVLNGKVAYTLIDETGIRHFKPMDVFSALRLSKPTARRFSMYECLGESSKQSEKRDSDKLHHPVSAKMSACMVAERLA